MAAAVRKPRGVAGALALLVVALIAMTAPAVGAGPRPLKREARTVALGAGRVTTVNVPYPNALEFDGARYSGTVKILPPPAGAHGRRPNLRLIEILSRESAEGGSLFRVRIRNANPPGTLPARALITALTSLPASS